MKNIFLCILLFLSACSNIDKREYYYNNSVKLNVVFNEELKSFKNGYLRISLLGLKDDNIIDEKFVYDITHVKEDTHNKKILVNFNYKGFEIEKTSLKIELFADTNSDNIIENRVAYFRENKSNISKKYYVFEFKEIKWNMH